MRSRVKAKIRHEGRFVIAGLGDQRDCSQPSTLYRGAVRMFDREWLGLLFICFLGGCAELLPSGRPPTALFRIDGLRMEPGRTIAGCPVTISLNFAGANGDPAPLWVVRHVWRSSMSPDSAPLVLILEPGEVRGPRGSLTSVVRPRRYGVNWVHVQLEDSAGNSSNVLKAPIVVDAPVPWRATYCPT